MDGLIALAVILVIGVPIAAVVALVMVLGARGRVAWLEGEVARLSGRVRSLEGMPEPTAVRPSAAPDLDAGAPATTTASQAEPMVPIAPDVPTPTAIDTPAPTANIPAPAEPEAIAARGGDEAAHAPPPETRPAAPRSLEERIGTRWAVWVGGVALAFGLIFLVQYSIEQGLFGPAARLAMTAGLSLAVIGAGEWLRRSDLASRVLAGYPTAHVPGILTAAGAAGLFADVWAAHALYGFLGPAAAFLALGTVAVATIAAALVHGPWLGVLGILAAFAAPALVQSDRPNPEALAGFLLVVTASAFTVARIRLWRWVAAVALGLALLWGVVFMAAFPPLAFPEITFAVYAFALFALTAGVLVVSIDARSPVAVDVPLDRFGLIALTATTALVLLAFDAGVGALGSVVLVATLAILAALAWRVPAVVPAVVIAGLAAVLAAGVEGLDVARSLGNDTFAVGADGLVALRPRVVARFLELHGLIGAGLIAVGLLGAWRATPQADRASGWFALAGTGFPLLSLVVVWGRVTAFESHLGFAALAAALAFGFAGACARLIARESRERPSLAVATHAVGAIAALGTTAAIALDHAALTVALAAMIPAIAWVWARRPIGALRVATAIVGVVVLGRLAWDPAITAQIGTTPIFNALLAGYGVPALGGAYAAWTFRTTADDVWRAIVEGLTLIFVGLLALVEIRHLANGGNLHAHTFGLTELGLDVATAFLLSAGAQKVAGRFGSRLIDVASIGVALTTCAVAVPGLLMPENPVLTGRPVGGLLSGALLFGYALPALSAALAARMARRAGRPRWFVATLAATAYVLGFAWITLLVRHAFHGPVLRGRESDAEMWAYSAVWLAYGVATLGVGLWLSSKPVRLLSGLVISATACKVFLLDLAGVGGVWRAFSFIGLGFVLIGIALVYQRFLFPRGGKAG